MKKKTLSLFLAVALFAMSLAACGKDDTPIRSEEQPLITNTDKEENPDINNEEIPETPVIPDIIKDGDDEEQEDNTDKDEKPEQPDIDFLYTAPEDYESFEIVQTFNGSQYSIFSTETENGLRYGIINMSGEVVVQPTYTILGYCDWHGVIYAEPFAEGDEPIVLDEKYKIDLHYGHGGTGRTYYVFDKPAGKMFTYSFNYDCFETREVTAIDMLTPYVIYNGAERILSDNFSRLAPEGQIYQTLVEYSLGYNEYEFPDGRITDGAECEFISDIGSIVNLGKLDYMPYAGFVNDYMVISRGGKLGFVNGIGKESVPTIFEGAGQAYGDRAWVKHKGTWGIINLG